MMTSHNPHDLMTILADAAMRALSCHIAAKGLTLTDEQTDAALAALRQELLAGYDDVLQETRNAVEARMPESMLRQILNVNCNLFAARALRACGLVENADA